MLTSHTARSRRGGVAHGAAAGPLFAILFAAALQCAASAPIMAQDYPARTIKIMTNSGAGGTFDVFVRALASELHKRWGRPVIVEPRPGGNFMIAGRACADSLPDGYSLCALSGETLVYSEFLYKSVPYSPRADFAPVTNLFFNTQVLIASAALGIKTLRELLVVAKSKPLAFSAPAVAQRLFLERLNRQHGMEMVNVPFRGGGEAVTALLNGSAPLLFSGGSTFPQLIEDGAAVGLAVDSPRRSPLFPQVPTLLELGYSDKLSRNYLGLVVPAATPRPIIERVHREVVAIMNDPVFRQQNLVDRGLEPIGDSPEEFARFIDDDRASFAETTREAKIERQ